MRLARRWPDWRRALHLVTPETVVRRHRRALALAWSWTSGRRQSGRPAVAADVRALIRQRQAATPRWGAPRLHGALRTLGIAIAQTTVATYLWRHRRPPPSQTWRAVLPTHVAPLAAIDAFTVPTATCHVVFVVVVRAQDRRRLVPVHVTAHPTAAWTAHPLREAWPDDTAPRVLRRNRAAVDGTDLRRAARAMSLEAVVTAPQAPWQHPFVERLIGSLRRDCLDQVIVWNARA